MYEQQSLLLQITDRSWILNQVHTNSMLAYGSGGKIAVRTKLNFLVENELSYVEDLVLVLLSDVIGECGLGALSVEEYVYEAVLADLTAPNLSDCELVTLALE